MSTEGGSSYWKTATDHTEIMEDSVRNRGDEVIDLTSDTEDSEGTATQNSGDLTAVPTTSNATAHVHV